MQLLEVLLQAKRLRKDIIFLRIWPKITTKLLRKDLVEENRVEF